MPFPAARGSEDDEEEIASPPFETLDTTHLSPPPVDAISSLIRYLEESRLSADNRRIQDDEMCQRDEERRLRDKEARRKEEDSRFQVLVTLLSPRHRPHSASSARDHLFTSTTPRVGASGATPKGRESRDIHRFARRISCGCHHPPSRRPLASMWPTAHRHCGPDSSFQVFRQWCRLWEDYSTMLVSQRVPRHKQLTS
ncbi:hypothetical protein GWK47_034107 [Chionoecetes opilio]|uniref:Uncharacterized protein n=1 Tax=Chionoecetes opilio TaxID=41210 RepID=A0A8J5D024_CHIOP|nr:hypothetical protein GWK47_034107 [Chionoecetes opilio]